ncbi:hypothetical protein [Corynebacterium auriscanis]|uniref:hypothetical protein n=1 Tax=Corynebacterium auriscanis TaxID=99807 RepID=UPI003CEDAECA
MNRELTSAERDVCAAMITSAHDDEYSISTEDRARWLRLIPETSVRGVCGCGTCPSIDLAYQGQPVEGGSRIVLQAETTSGNALVMLFIDGDLLSYLEVAPVNDETVPLPNTDDLRFP